MPRLSATSCSFVPSSIRNQTTDEDSSAADSHTNTTLKPTANEFHPTLQTRSSQVLLDPTTSSFEPQRRDNAPQESGATTLSRTAKMFIPMQEKTRLCRFFLEGSCRNGIACRFLHDTTKVDRDNQHPKEQKTEATKTIQLDVGISCEFEPGLSIKNVTLGNKQDSSKTVVVSGLRIAKQADIESRLKEYGVLSSISIQRAKDGSYYATATFVEQEAASRAAQSLHGTSSASWSKEVSFTESSVISVVVKEQAPASSGISVKVQWYAPSRCAWAHFSYRRQAEKAAQKLNQKKLNGRVIEAKFQRPSPDQITSFSVWIGNLSENTTTSHIKRLVQAICGFHSTSVSLGKLPYSGRTGPDIVKMLLEGKGGPLISFVQSPPGQGQKRKALVKFAREEDADRAVTYFQQKNHVADLGGKLFVQPIHTRKYTIPSIVATAVSIELRQVLKETYGDTIRCSIFPGASTTTVSLQADSKDTINALKKQTSTLVLGEVIRDPSNNGKVLWSRYVAGESFLDDCYRILSGDDRTFVFCDLRRQEVRVYGTEKRRKRIAETIVQRCKDFLVEAHAVPISPTEYNEILMNGRTLLDKITRASGSSKVSLDVKNRSLLVEGSQDNADKARAFVSKLLRTPKGTDDEDETECPVCLCPVEEDDGDCVQLSCTHTYCSDCFRSWMTGTSNCQFPLVCLGDSCSSPVSLSTLQSSLGEEPFQRLLRHSLSDHVRRNPAKYQFCFAPACNGILAKNASARDKNNSTQCSTCSQTFCVTCQASHDGMTCHEYKMETLPPDHLRLKIIEEILTLRCPRCSQAFVDFDGCFALSCGSCPCKFCGWCLHDCGDGNAHPHVATCSKKEAGSGTYFGTVQMFETAQNKRRRQALTQFLAGLKQQDKVRVKASIRQDLQELGLSV